MLMRPLRTTSAGHPTLAGIWTEVSPTVDLANAPQILRSGFRHDARGHDARRGGSRSFKHNDVSR